MCGGIGRNASVLLSAPVPRLSCSREFAADIHVLNTGCTFSNVPKGRYLPYLCAEDVRQGLRPAGEARVQRLPFEVSTVVSLVTTRALARTNVTYAWRLPAVSGIS